MKNCKLSLLTAALLSLLTITFAIAGDNRVENVDRTTLTDGINLAVQEPYQKSATVTLSTGESAENLSIDVPSGKLFVIETVTAYGSAPSDQRVSLSLSTHVAPDNSYRSHYLTAERQTVNGETYYRATHALKLYADVPNFNVRVERNASPDSVTFRFTVSGYLVTK
jgi:hypothetical protein